VVAVVNDLDMHYRGEPDGVADIDFLSPTGATSSDFTGGLRFVRSCELPLVLTTRTIQLRERKLTGHLVDAI
jgi:hypothetical protein